MDYEVRKKLIQDFLNTWASIEYECDFQQAYEKSKATQREFNNLDGMVRDLISTVERIVKTSELYRAGVKSEKANQAVDH